MKITLKAMSLILAIFISLMVLGACAASQEQTGEPTSAPTEKPAQETQGNQTQEPSSDEVTYPLADGESFTCWWPNDLVMSGVVDYNETPFFQYMEKKTGVHLVFYNPSPQGAA
ncbi:MAG: hypothetical protein GX193_03020, partial [Clostridiales bacterium]|nr:hypothetical protein [Clostridiales bacterium]